MDSARSLTRSPVYVATNQGNPTTSAAVSLGVGTSSVSGQLALGMLGTAVVFLVAFYYWTRHVQRGA